MEHALYLDAIKTALRARGTTYADLAGRLKMTESGVKKMLNAKDISLRRILQICEVLDLLPGELFAASEQAAIPVIRFNDAQEQALLKSRELLAAFWQFTIERKSAKDLAREQAVPLTEIRKRLQHLVSLDLVSQRRGQFLPKLPRKFRWPENSRLAMQLNHDWSLLTLKRALQQGSHRLIALRLSPELARDFTHRLQSLFDETVREAEREEITSSELSDHMALFATSAGSIFSTK